MIITDEEVITFLRKFRYIGYTSINPSVEELLVSYGTATEEINFHFKVDFTESQIREILRKQDISRRTLEDFVKIKKQAKIARNLTKGIQVPVRGF